MNGLFIVMTVSHTLIILLIMMQIAQSIHDATSQESLFLFQIHSFIQLLSHTHTYSSFAPFRCLSARRVAPITGIGLCIMHEGIPSLRVTADR